MAQVKYLGRLPIKASRDSPPDGQTCAITVSHLSRLRSRNKHRYGAAKQQAMCVSCSRGAVVLTAHDGSTGQSMRIPLLEVTCVADHDAYVCFVAGKLRADGVLACWSHAFECESDWASRYLREEIIGACQVAFGRARRESVHRQARAAAALAAAAPVAVQEQETRTEAQAAAAANSEESDAQPSDDEPDVIVKAPREISEGDTLFYDQSATIRDAISQSAAKQGAQEGRPTVGSRGDGLWWECCGNPGFCVCRRADKLFAGFGATNRKMTHIDTANLLRTLASTTNDKGASLKQFQSPSDLTQHLGLNFDRASGMISRSEFQHKCRQPGPLRSLVVTCDLDAVMAARAKVVEARGLPLGTTSVVPLSPIRAARASTSSVDSFGKITTVLNHVGNADTTDAVRRETAWSVLAFYWMSPFYLGKLSRAMVR
jgi:hypothetical protein